jgi:CheY-like chemotaxis protein/nitrogen-specific signal transduction histidine kinase
LLESVAERTWLAVERLRSEAALRASEQALKEADRRKDEFLAMLAHELRNPLAPIRNAAQVLKLLGPVDARQQWAREIIERQTQHLTRLVDDLLDVSRITRGKVKLAREPLDLAVILHRAAEVSRPLIDARRHRLTVAVPPEPVRLEGDLTRLVQVVGNLLNNAAKYTDEGGHIRLEAAREGREAVIRVRDNGMGLPADLLPHVFDLFSQADRSLDRSQGGLGIGLTLVRRLVEMHGGRVEARSDGPGQGSEFIVRLPAETSSVAPSPGAAAGDSARPASGGLKVLVVEDNVDSAKMMSFMLELGGHQVRMAHDGAEALEAARAFGPHAVLCDIGLPGMNGYEVAARLRQQPDFQQTPLIALTGYGEEEARRRSKEAGFDYHLVKPVEPDALGALLGSLRGTPGRA